MHEGAVVHTFTVPVAAALAWAEREGGVGGRDFLTGLALGVDVACHLGVASKSPLRFFRTATAGAFGAAAAIGRLAGFDAATLVNAFGAVLGQLSGTMQAHIEGSPMLGMQVGFNARNAIVACDMATRGLAAPESVLEGPFGFFPLFEGEHALGPVLGELGETSRVTEVSHKPYPCGRATHAVVDACLEFRERLGLDRAARDVVEQVTARVLPLVHRLVGRPVTDDMDVNYARLCCRYVAASALLRGRVVPEDFQPAALRDPDILELARRVDVIVDGNPDPNALVPVTVEINPFPLPPPIRHPPDRVAPRSMGGHFRARVLPVIKAEAGEIEVWRLRAQPCRKHPNQVVVPATVSRKSAVASVVPVARIALTRLSSPVTVARITRNRRPKAQGSL